MSVNSSRILVEVCVDSVVSAVAAERGGASRIELCSSLIEGGVTPSAGLIEKTRASISLPMHVMIRPRAGDFYYDEHEFETMQGDIELAKSFRADGIVLGLLNPDGTIDVGRTEQLVRRARPLAVTFHRAFDMSADVFRALEDLCLIGVDRVLTSGGAARALLGREAIAQLVAKARGRIVVMAGSGIKPENVRALVDETGVREIHVGLRSTVLGPMKFRNPHIAMGPLQGREYERNYVREEDVRNLCLALPQCNDNKT